MKNYRIVSILIAVMSFAVCHAQLNVPGGVIGTSSNSNVGVGPGNSSPQTNLHVKGVANNPVGLRLNMDLQSGTYTGFGNFDFLVETNNELTLKASYQNPCPSQYCNLMSTKSIAKFNYENGLFIERITDLNNNNYYIDPSASTSFKFAGKGNMLGSLMIGSQKNPIQPLHIQTTSTPAAMRLENQYSVSGPGTVWVAYDIESTLEGLVFRYNSIPTSVSADGAPLTTSSIMRVSPSGMISAKGLTIDGKVEAEEIEVKNIAADFVFAKDYKLTPLAEVEAFINENGHLPGVAPAEETAKGVELGKFNTLLLQKVEELTLYMIELKKENELLKAEVSSLK